jgi:hypothetical protein
MSRELLGTGAIEVIATFSLLACRRELATALTINGRLGMFSHVIPGERNGLGSALWNAMVDFMLSGAQEWHL